MRILYVITQADGGGAQKYTLTLAQHFGGALAAGREDSKLFDAAASKGIKTFPLKHLRRAINPWHDLLAVWEIRQLIKSYEPDIVHLNSSKAGVVGSFAAMGLKTKVVFTAHGFIFSEPLPWVIKSFYLSLEKVASEFRDYIIAVSDADRKSALDYKLIRADKISTIHNGIGQIDFLTRDEARRQLNLPLDKKIIGAIAKDYPTKGLDVLEKAAMLMKSNSLIIVRGYGLKEINLDGKFDKKSVEIDLASYLKAFDVMAIPSRKEGFPFLLLEAMQAGLPIVATRVGGIPEALDDAGILVEPDDTTSLANALDKVASDENLSYNLSKRALERSSLFTEEKMLLETKKVYVRLLENNA